MKSLRLLPLILSVSVALIHPAAAAQLTVSVTHDLEIARPAETITIPWAEVAKALPGALLQQISVKNSAGESLP